MQGILENSYPQLLEIAVYNTQYCSCICHSGKIDE